MKQIEKIQKDYKLRCGFSYIEVLPQVLKLV